jgi:hypothetical protein
MKILQFCQELDKSRNSQLNIIVIIGKSIEAQYPTIPRSTIPRSTQSSQRKILRVLRELCGRKISREKKLIHELLS